MTYSYEPHALADLEVGDSFETPGRTITEADLVLHSSLTGDWTELHTNAEYASERSYSERIVHGPLTYAIAVGSLLKTGVFERTLRAFLGMTYMAIPRPTFVGDTVSAVGTVEECRHVESRSNAGFVRVDVTVSNQDDDPVMSFDLQFLVDEQRDDAAGDPGGTADEPGGND